MSCLNRFFIWLVILSATGLVRGNMSSPIYNDNKTQNPFVSDFADIVHEDIYIHFTDNFSRAHYKIKYQIKCTKGAHKVPMIFYAHGYSKGFRVWLNGQEIQLKHNPLLSLDRATLLNSFFKKDNLHFEVHENDGDLEIPLMTDHETGIHHDIHDLHYIEFDFLEGEQLIEVEYTAKSGIDNSGWVKKKYISYALCPAKNWRSFGSLTVDITAENNVDQLSVNFNQSPKRINNHLIWSFMSMPRDFMVIYYTPEISTFAEICLFIGPHGITLLAMIAFFILTYFVTKRYRKNYPHRKYSPIVIFGGLLSIFIFAYVLDASYDWIDDVIGDNASRFHGYIRFFNYLFVPFFAIISFATLIFFDRKAKSNS